MFWKDHNFIGDKIGTVFSLICCIGSSCKWHVDNIFYESLLNVYLSSLELIYIHSLHLDEPIRTSKSLQAFCLNITKNFLSW